MSGPVSFVNGARSRVKINILKLAFEETIVGSASKKISPVPLFLPVGNWSEGISYDVDGLKMGDKMVLSSEKPVINKTLIITTTDVKFI